MSLAVADLVPFAPTDDEILEIWERFASKDPYVVETLLHILNLVCYPASGRQQDRPFSPAITVLLKIIFNYPRYPCACPTSVTRKLTYLIAAHTPW
jgi:hypothetical protein